MVYCEIESNKFQYNKDDEFEISHVLMRLIFLQLINTLRICF